MKTSHIPGTETKQREQAFRAILVLTVPVTLVLGYANLQLEADRLLLLNLALLGVVLALLLIKGDESWQPIRALAYLAALFGNIIAMLARPDLHPGVTASMAMIPVLSYLLLETWLALPVTLVSVCGLILGYFAGSEIMPYRLDTPLLAHIITPTVGLFVLCHFYSRSRSHSVNQMLERILQDPLTGLWNREKLTSELQREQRRVKRTGKPLSLVLIDLDHFKALNDRYGHDAGDDCLKFFARMLGRRLRDIDLACRIGGEEFALLLPETDLNGAMELAEDLRQYLAACTITHEGHDIEMTLSAGVAQLGVDGVNWMQIYRTADRRLYACKARGRNCVLGSDEGVEEGVNSSDTSHL